MKVESQCNMPVCPFLGVLAAGYGAGVRLRNRGYDRGWIKTVRLDVPVVCVGNITTGGVGKTPMVRWIVRRYAEMGKRAAILTRGYRGGEEAVELAETLPETPVIVNPDRVAGGREATQRHRPDVLVMDDGFQHRRFHRDRDIVLIDATNPFGGGRLLPSGRLREPLAGLKRADILVLTRSDRVDAETLDGLKKRLLSFVNQEKIVCARHGIVGVVDARSGKPVSKDEKDVLAVCGVGNPEAFLRSVQAAGFHVNDRRIFADHYPYRERDVIDMEKRAATRPILTTRKDWIKLRELVSPAARWWILDVEIEIVDNKEELKKALWINNF